VERAVLSGKPMVPVFDSDRPLCNVVAELPLAETEAGSKYAFDRRVG